ncbi:myosin light chain kinase, smooth muscle-like [Schistocerca piceifrons]|uniref:myosin light chain kinase, smooth muscle-like n=1 Tax=Schistocerca piceifrons TaxID=274613 RepID=UPI001F5FDA6D|nr:myosin light chain kinase, smooth muscle-like [Schistocerca piceifrons]
MVAEAARGVRPALFITRPDSDVSAAVGEDVSVSFRVTGEPKPQVTWSHGLRDVTHSARTLKETSDDYVRLTLKRARPSDAGTYCVLARNVYGCDRAFFTLKVRQRARSLTPGAESRLRDTTEEILRDIRDSEERERRKDVPVAISAEPVVSDQGRNWLTLTWPKCEARGGVPVLAYRVEAWQLGGDAAGWTELGVSPINSYDAFNLKPGAEYRFRVTPRNRYGWGESVATSAPITVGRPRELPEFVAILPGQLKALAGSDITLECQVRGEPAPEVRWYRDGGELEEDPPRLTLQQEGGRCRLVLRAAAEADAGRYMCDAANSVGRVSTFARLQVVHDPSLLEADSKLKREAAEAGEGVEAAPQFTMRLRDRRVQVTYPVRMTCQVAGWPAPTVTWTKDGADVTPDDRRSMTSDEASFHTLELSHAALEDSGEYCATARNAHGAVSCRATLVVDKGIRAYVAPDFVFELEPAAAAVPEGGELRLRAQVEAYPAVGVMWHRDGVRLRPSRRAVMTLDHDGAVQLSLGGVTRRDAGVYTCTATNAVGRAETSATVTVLPADADAAPATDDDATTDSVQRTPHLLTPDVPYSQEPMFLTKPRSTEAREGDTVVIQCEVVGDPKPDVFWLRDFLKPDYYRDAAHFRRQGDGPCYQLEIPHAKLDFTGAYSVVARNCHGEAKAVISLQIYAKGQGKEDGMEPSSVTYGRVQTLPCVRRALADRRCCDGDAVTLECRVFATPLPDVRWEKDGRLIPLGGDFVAEVEGETARLSIAHVFPEDEGQYTCVASNALGSARTSACLLVDVPEEKETLLSRQLSRPPALLSAGSTPRSTPRTTPTRSQSPTVSRERRRPTTPSGRRARAAAPPRFYAVPHNRVAEEGETVRLQCACAGHPQPWTTWHKDGRELAHSARVRVSERDDLRLLEIREVTREDAGLYRVTLENALGRVQASARIDVIERRGRSSTGVRAWSASPRTSPTPGRRLGPAPQLTAYRAAAAAPSAYSGYSSYYRRAGAGDGGDQPMDGDVEEGEAGARQQQPQPVFAEPLPPTCTAVEGSPLELRVRLHTEGEQLSVTWSREGVPLPDCRDFRYGRGPAGRRSLLLWDVFPEDAGLFRCEARGQGGRVLAVSCTRLCVLTDCEAATPSAGDGRPQHQQQQQRPVAFLKSPAPVMARRGASASFVARVSDPRAAGDVVWTVAGRDAATCSRCHVETTGDESVLTVRDVQPQDGGAVECSLPEEEGEEEGEPAAVTRGPRDVVALRGDTATLSAAFRGSPPPTVRWLRAGRELSAGGRLSIETAAGESRLTLSRITADDSGKYVVCVANALAEDCHYASLAVEGPPDPPKGRPSVCAVSGGPDCHGACALVAWSSAPYDGGCIVTGYSVEMRRADEDHWTTVADSCLSLSHHVSGLSEGYDYQFRVRAHNRHGASEPGLETPPFAAARVATPDGVKLEEEEEDVPEEEDWDSEEVSAGGDFASGYEVLQELGKGRYGVVHLVRHRRSQRLFAGKFLRCVKAADRDKARAEVDIMRRLRHPKLLRLAAVFEAPREVVVVTEYISGGELFERVVADDFTLTERDCVLFMRQICEGVQYMHQNSVAHLDLKPENIMCRTRTSHQIKLIDFGLARILTPGKPERVLFGTPEFIPPEIINYEPIGFESDMWSVGVICYVLLSGLSPFMGDNDIETFANITRADYDFDDEAFDAISQDAKDFISELLVKRKEKRLTAEQCLQHRWLTQMTDAISCVRLCTDKLKKFIIRRKWQKTGNAIRALGRMATLSAATRRNSTASGGGSSPRPSLSGPDEVAVVAAAGSNNRRPRAFSERSDSGISDCSVSVPYAAGSRCLAVTEEHEEEEEGNTGSETDNESTCAARSSKTAGEHSTDSFVTKNVECLEVLSEKIDNIAMDGTEESENHTEIALSLTNSVTPVKNLKFAMGDDNKDDDCDINDFNYSSTASMPSSCNKKTASLKHQNSADSGVHLEVVSSSSRRNSCSGTVKSKVTAFQQMASAGNRSPVTGEMAKTHSGSAITASREHSTNFQKAAAFWKR